MDKKNVSEAGNCLKFITPALVVCGWYVNEQVFQEVTLKAGRVVVRGHRSARDKRTIVLETIVWPFWAIYDFCKA